MNKLFFTIAVIASQISFASETVLFQGRLNSNPQAACQISVIPQAPGSLYQLVYSTEKRTLNFFNETIEPNTAIKANGVFEKNKGSVNAEIGAIIFPIGIYYDVTIEQKENLFEIKTLIRTAHMFGYVTVHKSTEICQ